MSGARMKNKITETSFWGKGAYCFLGRGSGGGGLFAARFVFPPLIASTQCLCEMLQGVMFFEVVQVHFEWQVWDFVPSRLVVNIL